MIVLSAYKDMVMGWCPEESLHVFRTEENGSELFSTPWKLVGKTKEGSLLSGVGKHFLTE